MHAVEVGTLLGLVTIAGNEKIASVVHGVDRGRLKSAESLHQFEEQSEIELRGWMARIHGTRVLGQLEEKLRENPNQNWTGLVQVSE